MASHVSDWVGVILQNKPKSIDVTWKEAMKMQHDSFIRLLCASIIGHRPTLTLIVILILSLNVTLAPTLTLTLTLTLRYHNPSPDPNPDPDPGPDGNINRRNFNTDNSFTNAQHDIRWSMRHQSHDLFYNTSEAKETRQK